MIPAPFAYLRPDDLEGALAALSAHGDDAVLLAGGHSLLPLMKLRLAVPAVLVDIGRIRCLQGVRRDGDRLVIGATTTHDAVQHDALVRAHCGVLADVIATIGDPQVRHRGTFGGALAHGDAAGDLPAVIRALDATMVLRGPAGVRNVAAADFFHDYLETARAPDEILVEVYVPVLDASWGYAYEKFVRAAQSWALVGACVMVRRDGAEVGDARVALTNVATVPLRSSAAEEAIVAGGRLTGGEVVGDDVEVTIDRHADAGYRRHLARVLTARALERALRA